MLHARLQEAQMANPRDILAIFLSKVHLSHVDVEIRLRSDVAIEKRDLGRAKTGSHRRRAIGNHAIEANVEIWRGFVVRSLIQRARLALGVEHFSWREREQVLVVVVDGRVALQVVDSKPLLGDVEDHLGLWVNVALCFVDEQELGHVHGRIFDRHTLIAQAHHVHVVVHVSLVGVHFRVVHGRVAITTCFILNSHIYIFDLSVKNLRLCYIPLRSLVGELPT